MIQLKRWYVESGAMMRPVCWLAGLIPLAGGCAQLPPDARAQMVQAEQDYRAGRTDDARSKLDQIITKYPKAPDAAEAYYLRAQIHAQRGNRAPAQADLRQCLSLSANSDLTARAHAMSATLAFESGNSREAAEHYREAFKQLPDRAPYDLARYRYGYCLAQEGDWKSARQQWSKVVANFAGSDIASQASRMLSWPGDYFSLQCGAYREQKAAIRQKERLIQAGLNARVETRKRSGETLQMVYVGQYPRFEQAQSAQRTVQKHAPGAVIVPQ